MPSDLPTMPAVSTHERVFTAAEKQKLRGEVFRGARLDAVDFSGADLENASFERIVLSRASFAGANLRGTRFILCDLRHANFAGATLVDNRFDRTTLAGASGLSTADRHAIEAQGGTFSPLATEAP